MSSGTVSVWIVGVSAPVCPASDASDPHGVSRMLAPAANVTLGSVAKCMEPALSSASRVSSSSSPGSANEVDGFRRVACRVVAFCVAVEGVPGAWVEDRKDWWQQRSPTRPPWVMTRTPSTPKRRPSRGLLAQSRPLRGPTRLPRRMSGRRSRGCQPFCFPQLGVRRLRVGSLRTSRAGLGRRERCRANWCGSADLGRRHRNNGGRRRCPSPVQAQGQEGGEGCTETAHQRARRGTRQGTAQDGVPRAHLPGEGARRKDVPRRHSRSAARAHVHGGGGVH